LDKEAAVL